jgi:DNA-binding beta-propeller fold protein YncE
MSRASRVVFALAMVLVALIATSGRRAYTQAVDEPTNSAPNPYQTIENHFKMPAGRTWGSTSAVAIDKDGKSIWVAERCGANSCLADSATGKMSDLPTILKFDDKGNLVKSFGAGMLVFPHGIEVDPDGNIWVTDGQDNAPRAPRGSGAGRGATPPTASTPGGAPPAATPPAGAQAPRGAGGARGGPGQGATIGHSVYKFSPDGKLLMTLGKPGGALDPDYFLQPNDVLVTPDGTIFVAEGHSSGANANARILKFSKDGKLIKVIGKKGTGPGEFDQPHTLALDSGGRLFVGDRSNNRIQILDQEGTFIAEWKQFSRPSGIWIDRKSDTIYVADSESGSVNPAHGAWKRGIRSAVLRMAKSLRLFPTRTLFQTPAARKALPSIPKAIFMAPRWDRKP